MRNHSSSAAARQPPCFGFDVRWHLSSSPCSTAEARLLRCALSAPRGPPGHCSVGYRAIAAAARSRHHVPLQTSRTGGGQGSAESHGRVQPAAGVPPPAPGRGKLRRGGGMVGGFKRGGQGTAEEKRGETDLSTATHRLGCANCISHSTCSELEGLLRLL